MITSPAMVSKEVAESMVMSLKLLPRSILIDRMVSFEEGAPMIWVCAVV